MLTWTNDLSINVVEIDEQHKDLFARINYFLEAIDRGTDEAALQELMDFLEQYIVVHFDFEEKYMDKYSIHGYPDAVQHKAAHKAFKRDFIEFKSDILATKVSPQFRLEFRNWITNWWLIHIVKIDTGLGAFIRRVILF